MAINKIINTWLLAILNIIIKGKYNWEKYDSYYPDFDFGGTNTEVNDFFLEPTIIIMKYQIKY